MTKSSATEAGKESCRATQLNRCTAIDSLWNRKAPSLTSPDTADKRLPRDERNIAAALFIGPKVSKATGKNSYAAAMSEYLAQLLSQLPCRQKTKTGDRKMRIV